MTTLTKRTAKFLCVLADTASQEVTLEAQRLLDCYNDPDVDTLEKTTVKAKLDTMIQQLEEKVETARSVRVESNGHGPAGLPAV